MAASKQLSPGTSKALHSSGWTCGLTPASTANRATHFTWEGTEVTAVTCAPNSCAQKIAPPPKPQPTSPRLDDGFGRAVQKNVAAGSLTPPQIECIKSFVTVPASAASMKW
jgi:hypothetical protein